MNLRPTEEHDNHIAVLNLGISYYFGFLRNFGSVSCVDRASVVAVVQTLVSNCKIIIIFNHFKIISHNFFAVVRFGCGT